MPKSTKIVDRRLTGNGNNTPGVVQGKSNMQDQRTAGKYSPPAPSAGSEFSTGISAGRPMSAGAPVGRGTRRTVGRAEKLGGKD